MRIVKYRIVFMLLLCLFVFKIDVSVSTENKYNNVPNIVVLEPQFTFNDVPEGTKLAHDFIIQNKGGAPLFIENVKTA
ncbi:conserved hypothetical protein [Desulfamplus magnetovallimortis]|nr:conserved hypothetical protein [Desulfamplus magnetovallimortis]